MTGGLARNVLQVQKLETYLIKVMVDSMKDVKHIAILQDQIIALEVQLLSLQTSTIKLCEIVENIDDLSPSCYGLRAGIAVSELRQLVCQQTEQRARDYESSSLVAAEELLMSLQMAANTLCEKIESMVENHFEDVLFGNESEEKQGMSIEDSILDFARFSATHNEIKRALNLEDAAFERAFSSLIRKKKIRRSKRNRRKWISSLA